MSKEIIEKASQRMEKAITALNHDLATVRTGRANPNMLDRISVDYWGSPTPVNQVASVQVVEGRQLVIKPYDKSTLKNIEHAIFESDLGITPQNDGNVIRLVIPPLTEDRRKEYCKVVSKMAEQAKVAIRNIRRDANDEIKKGDFSEDEAKRATEKVQKKTDELVKKVDSIAKDKEKEIMTV